MKILIICHEYPPFAGGGGVGVRALAAELAARHHVDIIVPRNKCQKGFERSDGTEIHRVPVFGRVFAEGNRSRTYLISFASFVVSAVLKAIFLSMKNRYTLLHTHFILPAGIIGTLVSFLFRIPHVATAVDADIFDPKHEFMRPYANILVSACIRSVLRYAHHVVAISSYIRDTLITSYGFQKPISVIGYGIVCPHAACRREALDVSTDDFVLISVGRLVKRKGFDVLLSIMTSFRDENVYLIIVGTGPESIPLREQAKSAGIASRVRFVENADDSLKQQLLSASDLFVLHTFHEGQGLVYLEAMSAGLPIVTTDTGSQRDMIAEGVNGFLVPTNDTAAMIERINRLRHDRSELERMSSINIQKVLDFSAENIALKYQAVYDQLQ